MNIVKLTVNGQELELRKYVRNIVENIGLAIIKSLKIDDGVEGTILITISDKEMSIKIGTTDIPLNEFATKMSVNIVEAMVLQCDGYEAPIETIMIELA